LPDVFEGEIFYFQLGIYFSDVPGIVGIRGLDERGGFQFGMAGQEFRRRGMTTELQGIIT